MLATTAIHHHSSRERHELFDRGELDFSSVNRERSHSRPSRFADNGALNFTDPTGMYQQGNPVQSLTGFGNGTFNPYAQSLGRSTAALISPAYSSSSAYAGLSDFGSALNNTLYSVATTVLPGASLLRPAVGAALSSLSFAASGPIATSGAALGHHFVPVAVEGKVGASVLTPEARTIFQYSTSGPLPYSHAGDTWMGVTHGQYSNATETLLNAYRAEIKAPLKAGHAEQFVKFLEEGMVSKTSVLADVIAANKEAADAVKLWRTGFYQSVVEGNLIRDTAAQMNIEVSNPQVKALTQYRINGTVTKGYEAAYRTGEVLQVEQKLSLLAKAGKLAKITGGVVAKAAPVLLAMSAADAYAHGSRNGHTGVIGAADQTVANIMAADIAEDYALRPAATSWVEFVSGQFGLKQNSQGKTIPNQRLQRAGFDVNGNPIDKRR